MNYKNSHRWNHSCDAFLNQNPNKQNTTMQRNLVRSFICLAIPHLFERLFLISLENNRDCHITTPLSLKTMEVQIKGDQWNKRFRTGQVYYLFPCGSRKTWKAKNVKWQKAWVLGKQLSSFCVLSINIFHLSKFRPILDEVVICRREQGAVTNGSQFFACILLTSNHMIFLVQFGINQHSKIFQRPQIALALF